MSPNVFEINEDRINVVSEFYAMFFLVMLKNNLEDQYILGVTGPMGPVTF